MRAIFNTEKVEYELGQSGYTRNGHFVRGEVSLKQLSIGQPAIIEVVTNGFKQVITTDVVVDIKECPAFFRIKMNTEVHPYIVTINKKGIKPFKRMKIGTEKEVRDWAKKTFPTATVSYKVAPIPVRAQGVS